MKNLLMIVLIAIGAMVAAGLTQTARNYFYPPPQGSWRDAPILLPKEQVEKGWRGSPTTQPKEQ